jgi:hypothetical protein
MQLQPLVQLLQPQLLPQRQPVLREPQPVEDLLVVPGSSGGSGEGGSIATIDTAHERYTNRRRGRGDKWKIWKKKWLTFADKPSIWLVVKSAWLLAAVLKDCR